MDKITAIDVYAACMVLFKDEDDAWNWITRENPMFEGYSPLDYAREGTEQLQQVLDFIERLKYGVFS